MNLMKLFLPLFVFTFASMNAMQQNVTIEPVEPIKQPQDTTRNLHIKNEFDDTILVEYKYFLPNERQCDVLGLILMPGLKVTIENLANIEELNVQSYGRVKGYCNFRIKDLMEEVKHEKSSGKDVILTVKSGVEMHQLQSTTVSNVIVLPHVVEGMKDAAYRIVSSNLSAFSNGFWMCFYAIESRLLPFSINVKPIDKENAESRCYPSDMLETKVYTFFPCADAHKKDRILGRHILSIPEAASNISADVAAKRLIEQWRHAGQQAKENKDDMAVHLIERIIGLIKRANKNHQKQDFTKECLGTVGELY